MLKEATEHVFEHLNTLQLAEADGRPPMGHLKPLQFTVYAKYAHGFTSDWPGVKVVTFFEKTYTVPPTGLLNIDLDFPENATQIRLEVGAKANFRLKTTRPLNGTFYQTKINVLSRGNAVKTGFINLQNNLTAYFDMQITPEMAPIAKVILYALEEQSGQIFADSATINVDGTLQNKVASDIMIMCCEQRYVRFVKTK
ncbi:hypothetical protein KUTeg_017284 [Tegillarca granosa]|uniref:Alpha-2-macroglobulin bait region domain-containing protein n=1 Tax=Tegillarca granosa TaxID=220873 RepID=A0ABQ9EIL4_TEGGR|nr:hypothetical protein KUTeg_017284 [Tegillarca granosa]